MNILYKGMALVSVFVRQIMLPNPFEQLPVPPSIDLYGIRLEIPLSLLNWSIEPAICLFTFSVVGIYYRKGIDHPAKGSFLYLLFYCVHILALSIMAQFQFTTMAIVLVISGYIACQIGVAILANKIQTFSSYGF